MNRPARTARSVRTLVFVIATFCLAAATESFAFPIVIEPDNYANNQTLDTISPWVKLSTAVPPTKSPTFSVTAVETSVGTPAPASTGLKTFAHVGVPFWNTSRILRMDFHEFVSEISIDYISSGTTSAATYGRLEAYSWNNILLAADETAVLGDNQFETLNVAAPQIAYAFAYPPADPFGGLDNLRFNVVPEPNAIVLMLAAVGCYWSISKRKQPWSAASRSGFPA